MCRAFITVAAAVLALLAWPSTGSAAPAALSCGLPESQPVWLDFADSSVSFWRERFARPGVVVATGGPELAAEARAAGAATVHWDMYLRKRVGTPSDPADAALIEQRADSLFDYAVSVSGCQQPLIALNELWGASLPTPLTPTAERYRANVLRLVSRLAARGGRPALLVSSDPFTGGDAAPWWKSIAAVSDLVLENYANANLIWRDGPVDGSRRLRVRYRQSAARLLALGIPPSRIGIMIGFQTGPGTGGREGLTPRSRWFSVANWQALAVRQVARELRLAHLWSWGWAQRNERSNDPDKTYAACVWLWARDPGLCDAPGVLRREFDADRKTGQLDLPSGTRCMYGSSALTASSVAALAKVTRDRELALTALVVRAIERERARVSPTDALAVEGRIVGARFGGSAAAYRSALAEAGASLSVARGIIGDELRARDVFDRLAVSSPSAGDIARFRATYAPVLARRLVVSPAPSWLPDGSGLALATSAPESVFRLATGQRLTVRTAEGVFTVKAIDDTAALGAYSHEAARSAIVDALRSERRADAYAAWTIRMQKGAESRLVCERDRLPELGVVTLSTYAPFLSLHEAEAARWASARRP
ncbi:MAG: hypothetical protein HW413_486 [Thermoleophilia bacterium]|nr:hypothetical protein [Thermoleophilia bacterium]